MALYCIQYNVILLPWISNGSIYLMVAFKKYGSNGSNKQNNGSNKNIW